MGAISGALVAEALASGTAAWGTKGTLMLDTAEAHLAGSPIEVDLAPVAAIAAAVGLAGTGTPLLLDATTVALIDAVDAGLSHTEPITPHDPLLAKAAELARTHDFTNAIEAAGGDVQLAALTGMFAGLDGGLGAIPARLVSSTRSPDNARGRRYLCGLTNRLLGIDKPNWYDPRRRRGPKNIMDGLWVSNLYGISQFVADHPDGLVLSLCNEEGRVAGHPHHVTFHVEDLPKTDANPNLELVIDEVLAEIRSARASGQAVLLHCRHGASRTGLILRLLLIDELGISAEDALVEAQCLWPHTSCWNMSWNAEVERRAQLV